MILPEEIQTKLAGILSKKAQRGGEMCLEFHKDNFPFDLRNTFPECERIVLEIGCGWGEFTRDYARQNPGTLMIAIEKKLARVLSSVKTQRSECISNIRYLVLDVAWFFSGIFATNQFDEIMVNFPDPWPKARHHKHRFFSPEFADELAALARPGGRLTFATDDYAYMREATTVLENSGKWQNTQAPYVARCEIPQRPMSYFEKLHRDEGALIYFLEYAAPDA